MSQSSSFGHRNHPPLPIFSTSSYSIDFLTKTYHRALLLQRRDAVQRVAVGLVCLVREDPRRCGGSSAAQIRQRRPGLLSMTKL